jgi:sulfate/thiosulfate transport system substrate-binding protein
VFSTNTVSKGRKTAVALAVTAGVLASATAATATPDRTASTQLSLVAYSTPKDAYAKLIPAFQATAAGKDVTFTQSFGASGSQARAVASGLPADVVHLSLATDVDSLVKAGLVSSSWNKDAFRGMVTNSIAVLVVRKGNPKHVKTWADLIKPGISVITPNPFTSGGARWNIMAAWGALRKQGKTEKQANAYLDTLFHHVSVQDKSGRDAMNTFVNGKGDVAISYENEAIQAQLSGAQIDYVIPDQTILIENPIAVISKSSHPNEAKAFVAFLRSPKGQTIWAQNGYRPVLATVRRKFHFKNPKTLFSIDDLGGWKSVTTKFFDPRNGIITKIEQGIGVSTS